MNFKFLSGILLDLFSGEGETATPATAGGSAPFASVEQAASAARGDALAIRGITPREEVKTGEPVVRYGKQPAEAEPVKETVSADETGDSSNAGKTAGSQKPAPTLEDRKKAFLALANSDEHKDAFTAVTQDLINRRFRDHKTLEKQVSDAQPVLDFLADHYGLTGYDAAAIMEKLQGDDSLFSKMADEKGLTVEAAKEFDRINRENRAFRADKARRETQAIAKRLDDEVEEVIKLYPDFDPDKELADPTFKAMLKASGSVKSAYEITHRDEIRDAAVRKAREEAEKATMNNIRAKGARPVENGAGSQSGFVTKDDPSKLSRKEILDIAERALRGEKTAF